VTVASGEPARAGAKVQPKLRMVANASDEVNAIRAEHAAAVTVPPGVARRVEVMRDDDAVPVEQSALEKPVVTRKLRERPTAVVSAFVQLTRDPEQWPGGADIEGKNAWKGNLLTIELPVDKTLELSEEPWVTSVELGQPLAMPDQIVSAERPAAPRASARRVPRGSDHHSGAGVLVGLIDVGGFDFSHPDFLDSDGHTRFERIWDQGGNSHPPPAERGTSGFTYGAELRKKDMDRALDAAAAQGLPAYELEPQSQMSEGSHATHVASIAAGNRGVAPKATVAGVLISIPKSESERRLSFYDSTRIAHAVDYLIELARELGGLPLSINISLGTNGHAHDDSSAINRWIDAALTVPGRGVCIAAGNAGQERAEHDEDVGFIMGRVHANGQIQARELVADLEWNVVGNTVADISENELEIWYGPEDRFAVQVKPPGADWTDPIEPGQFIENRQLADGSFLSVYNELYHAANGANYIAVYLSPQLRQPRIVGVRAGEWLVRLLGRDVRNGTFHAWIERDDPRKVGRLGQRDAWIFPSFFSESSFVDKSTVSTLACGQRTVSVANLDEQRRRINITSSQGPTRDGRQKPDIAAPGTDIVAAKGFAPGDEWIAMTGTSMASPYVAGVVALMLATNSDLTGAQLGGIIKRSSQPLPGADFAWRDDAGAGTISAERCVEQAKSMRAREDIT
jgi:subtilisin family serine protease